MPKKTTQAKWKKHLLAYEQVYNTLRDLNYDGEICFALEEIDLLIAIRRRLAVNAGGPDGSEATEETDRTSELDETERGVVAGAGH